MLVYKNINPLVSGVQRYNISFIKFTPFIKFNEETHGHTSKL